MGGGEGELKSGREGGREGGSRKGCFIINLERLLKSSTLGSEPR